MKKRINFVEACIFKGIENQILCELISIHSSRRIDLVWNTLE